jgi:hypothetical protein
MPLHLEEVRTQGRSLLERVCACQETRKISLGEALEYCLSVEHLCLLEDCDSTKDSGLPLNHDDNIS